MKELTHMHLTVNARVDRNFLELPKEKAQKFVNELMKITNMKPLGPLNWSDAADLDFPGQSFVQMITTSHSSLHFFRDESGNGENNEIYFDLYSCKDFDIERTVEYVVKAFGIGNHSKRVTKRGREFPKDMDMVENIMDADRGKVSDN